MKREELIKFAKKEFKDHVATFKQLNEYTQEIEFRKPGTSYYYVRFLLNGNYLFACGDLGEAVYQLTEQARIERIASGYDLGYLTGKLRCVDGGKYTFDSDTAVERIKEDLEECDEECLTPERKEAYDTLMDLAKQCSSIETWNVELARHEDEADEVCSDWWEWLPGAGNELNNSVVLYWIALKMAGKQLGHEVKYFE
ncbi:MAG: hypothetical protein AB9856_14335 [Cellulosilyticaceae bacterium]